MSWVGMKAENYLCSLGKNQSPIDIDTSAIEYIQGSDLAFEIESYPNSTDFINIGSQVEVIANGTLCLDSTEYMLMQFHFHTLSEYLLDREFHSLKAHFVFQAEGK